jgi:hypothetical protein
MDNVYPRKLSARRQIETSPAYTLFLFSTYKTAKQGVLDIEGINSLSVSYSSIYERKRGGEENLE